VVSIGVAPNMLTRWVRETQPSTEKTFPGAGNPWNEELVRLKRELAQVTKERFLRDAARSHRALHVAPTLPIQYD